MRHQVATRPVRRMLAIAMLPFFLLTPLRTPAAPGSGDQRGQQTEQHDAPSIRDECPRDIPDRPGSGTWRFKSWSKRLDNLETNIPNQLSKPIQAADTHFVPAGQDPIPVPPVKARMQLQLHLQERENVTVRPHFAIDADLPNIEQRLRLFVETARANELPGKYLTEQEERGLHIGVRKWFEQAHLSADAGIRTRWRPQVFAQVTWSREFNPGAWDLRPMQRIFLNSTDGLGSLSSCRLNRWLGKEPNHLLAQTFSGKWTTRTEQFEWSANTTMAQIDLLLDENRRGQSVAWNETRQASGVKYSFFGKQDNLNNHRLALALRHPLYKKWIFGEFATGFEWQRKHNFKKETFLLFGIDMLFGSAAPR